MKVFSFLLGAILLFVSQYAHSGSGIQLDGDCGKYSLLRAKQYELPSQIDLYLYQDAEGVWLCYTLPGRSYGTMDLVLYSPKLAEPIHLHASSKLSEWPYLQPKQAPKKPDSEMWWNNIGWEATTVQPSRSMSPRIQTRYLFDSSREVFISKQRFGKGIWRLFLTINSVDDGSDKRITVTFPNEACLDSEFLIVNAY